MSSDGWISPCENSPIGNISLGSSQWDRNYFTDSDITAYDGSTSDVVITGLSKSDGASLMLLVDDSPLVVVHWVAWIKASQLQVSLFILNSSEGYVNLIYCSLHGWIYKGAVPGDKSIMMTIIDAEQRLIPFPFPLFYGFSYV